MTTNKSKTEYLKRYLESENKGKKKKKPKPSNSSSLVPRIKIIDRNIDVKAIKFGDEVEEDDADEAPVIAEVIDERPVEVKIKEVFESSRWKKLDSASDDEHHKTLPNSSHKRTHSDADDDSHRQNRQSKKRMDSDSDCSPPRLSQNSSQNKRVSRHDSGSDQSPPRNSKRSSKSVTQRQDSDSDISPPRHNNSSRSSKSVKRRNSDSDISPPRQNNSSRRLKGAKRQDSDVDLSPPRQSNDSRRSKGIKRQDSDSDMSPPRRNVKDRGPKDQNKTYKADNSQRDKRRNDSDSDLSPERQRPRKESSKKTRGSDSDLSPPRNNSGLKDEKKRPAKTLSGLKAGLQNAETLRLETHELRHRERQQIEMMGAELSGRDAKTIVRDRKTGKLRDLDAEDEEKEEEKRKLSVQQKKYSEWGKGIEQTESRKNEFSEDLYEMSKPLARHHGDDDLEEMLKNRIDSEDPMAEYMLKKRKKDDVARMPEYSGPPPPPNRFGLRPGYRWDGVDRSNGFEKRYFEKISSSKATEEEAYLWSVQDM